MPSLDQMKIGIMSRIADSLEKIAQLMAEDLEVRRKMQQAADDTVDELKQTFREIIDEEDTGDDWKIN